MSFLWGLPPTRFPGGLNDVLDTDVFAQMAALDPTRYHTYWNDFDQYVAADWTVTETQAGATQALIAENNGVLALTNSAADDDLNSIQKLPAAFLLDAEKKSFFSCRFAVNDPVESDVLVGLLVATATPFTDPTDGIFFLKADGAGTVIASVRQDATTGANNSPAFTTIAGDSYLELSWYYNGNGMMYYAVNGVIQGSLSAAAAFFPNTILTPTLSIRNGTDAAKILTVDYVLAMQER